MRSFGRAYSLPLFVLLIYNSLCSVTPIFQVKLEDVLDRKHLPPLGLKDFEEWLLFVEQCPENLYFILWLREYTAKYNAWAANVRAREEKERAKEARRTRARTRGVRASRRMWRKGRREMDDVLEVDEENEQRELEEDANDEEDDFDLDFDRRPRGYRVTWTARSAYSPSLALFFTRARETFFSPASAYELIVPPDLLSPFFVGSVSVASPSPGPPDFTSCSAPSPSSSSSSSPVSPHPQPQPHSPSSGLGFPYPLPHPDPAVFAPLQAHIEERLQLSLQRFVRAAYTNVGTFRATCGILAGCFALCVGCIPPLALAFASPSSSTSSSPESDGDTMRRWRRLYALPAMWLGLTLILASLRGVCLMVYVFGDFRQLRRFELERPPPPAPLTGTGGASAEKKHPSTLQPQFPPAAYAGARDARHTAYVLPEAMAASAFVTSTSTSATSTTSSASSSSSSSSYPAPGANAGAVRALTAPPKISIRIPPARGHLQVRGGGGGGGLAHAHAQGQGPVRGHVGTGRRSALSAQSASTGADAYTISISSTRKSGLGVGMGMAGTRDVPFPLGGDSDSDSDAGDCEFDGARGQVVLESDLEDDGDGDESAGDGDEDEDDSGIYVSPLMPPPEEAAENDPAVFSAALALVAQAKAKAGLAGVEAEGEEGVGEEPAERGLSVEEKEKEKEKEREKEKEKNTAPIRASTPTPIVNPNPTASFIPAFPYGAYQGTEEVDPWPPCVSSASECVSGARSGLGPGASGARRERESVSPVADRGPCWSVKKSRSRPTSSSRSRSCSRPGTGRSARSFRGGPAEKKGERDAEKNASDSGDAECSDDEDEDDNAGPGAKGSNAKRKAKAVPKLPMGPFDFDALPPVTRTPPQHLLHHLTHSHNLSLAHTHRPLGAPDLEKGLGLGLPAPALAGLSLGYGGDARLATATATGAGAGAGVPDLDLELGRAGSVHTPSTLAALFALFPVRLPSFPLPLPSFLRRRRAPAASSASAFADPYTAHLHPHSHPNTYTSTNANTNSTFLSSTSASQSQSQSHAYTYTYACPGVASPGAALGRFGGFSYGDGAASKGWRRAYAHVQRTPAFGPVTRVLSPVVSRAQWEIVVRAFVLAGLLSCVVEAALVALPARW